MISFKSMGSFVMIETSGTSLALALTCCWSISCGSVLVYYMWSSTKFTGSMQTNTSTTSLFISIDRPFYAYAFVCTLFQNFYYYLSDFDISVWWTPSDILDSQQRWLKVLDESAFNDTCTQVQVSKWHRCCLRRVLIICESTSKSCRFVYDLALNLEDELYFVFIVISFGVHLIVLLEWFTQLR